MPIAARARKAAPPFCRLCAPIKSVNNYSLTMKSGLLLLAFCPSSSSAFQHQAGSFNRLQNVATSGGSRIPLVVRYMQPSSRVENDEVKSRSRRLGLDKSYKSSSSSSDKRVQRTELFAATLDSVENVVDNNNVASLLGRLDIPMPGPKTVEAATKILSASLLITGNTVGTSMFVLPDAVGGVGMLNGSAIFLGKMMTARSLHVL